VHHLFEPVQPRNQKRRQILIASKASIKTVLRATAIARTIVDAAIGQPAEHDGRLIDELCSAQLLVNEHSVLNHPGLEDADVDVEVDLSDDEELADNDGGKRC
jgi:hypothetical protein